jgi:hypothetical protein
MRMLPARFIQPEKPVVSKKVRAKTLHVSPPIKGLADDAQSAETDVKFAGILTNFYVDDDRITCRAGFKKIATIAGGFPGEHLIPYYGEPKALAVASNDGLYDAETAALLRGGFLSNDWHWTSFSNLGDKEYTVMVNGLDGVISWDGTANANTAPVTITKIGKATSPAKEPVITVAAADIGKFTDNMNVIVSGADAGHASANGPHRIQNVGKVVNTFELVGVDSSVWGADQTTGTMRVVIQKSFIQEGVTAPAGNTWLNPKHLAIVIAHQNRLFFADTSNLAVYFLPLQQKDGPLDVLPMNAIFKKGGTIKAMATWTLDGGMGLDDQLVVFTTGGEVAIWSGIDPESDFTLVGVYRFDPPASKWSVLNYGGELYVLLPTGLTPMSAALKSGREGVETSDKNIVTRFFKQSVVNLSRSGWEVFLNPNSGRAFCNMPQGGGRYNQMIRNMAKPAWSEFRGIPARCWGWIEPYVYFADDTGNIYQMHPQFQSDDGKPIYVDVQTAWSQYKTPLLKHFKMILPYILTDGFPTPAIDVKVDFDQSAPINVPDITGANPNDATWDVATWDEDYWVSGASTWNNWTGVAALGRLGAVRMQAAVLNCSFSVTGWDLLYELGGV